VAALGSRIEQALLDAWPAAVAGALLDWRLTLPARGDPVVAVYHIGPPLGDAGEALLARTLGASLTGSARIADSALVATAALAPLGREATWRAAALPLLEWVAGVRGASACVHAPIGNARRTTADQRATLDSIRASAASRAGRVTLRDSSAWQINIVAGSCPNVPAPAAGAPSATGP